MVGSLGRGVGDGEDLIDNLGEWGLGVEDGVGSFAEDGFEGLDVGEDLRLIFVALTECVGRACLEALEEGLYGGDEENDAVEARVEPTLVGRASGEEEESSFGVFEECGDFWFDPEPVAFRAWFGEAVVAVNGAVASVGEFLDGGGFAGCGHAGDEDVFGGWHGGL